MRHASVIASAVGALVLTTAACGGSDSSGPVTRPPDTSTDAADGCPPEDETDTVTRQFDSEPPFCLDPDADYSAVVTTSWGDVTIDFDQEAAPLAVNSFVFLARNNYFDDTICHRAVRDFVVQCGDPTATGTGGPGYLFDDELPEAGEYQIGSVAMAHIPQPDTNGSQFFIITGPNGMALPPEYSLFGQVADESLGVVGDLNRLAPDDGTQAPIEEIRILDVEIIES